MPRTRADQDGVWKEILEYYPERADELCFPRIHALIDWSRGVEFLDSELRHVLRRGAIGRRTVDKLLQVYLKTGEEAWILLHLEVQHRFDRDFPLRLFVYAYRLFDRHKKPVITLALLADRDPDWRPQGFGWQYGVSGMQHQFEHCKILDFAAHRAALEQSANPFAVFVLAQLALLEASRSPRRRFAMKVELLRGLLRRGFPRSDVEALFRFLDWLITLPPGLEEQFDAVVRTLEEEPSMTFVTGIERRALARGIAEGKAEGKAEVVGQLACKRLGKPSEAAVAWLARFVTETDLDALLDRLLVVESWEDLLAGAHPAERKA